MKKKSIAIILSLAMMLQVPMAAGASEMETVDMATNVTTEYIVQMEEGAEIAQVLDVQEEAEITDATAEELNAQNMVVLELTEEAVEELENRDDVIAVEEDIILSGSSTELEIIQEEKKSRKVQKIDRREEQWNLDAIHLPQVSESVDVIRTVVLDSGVSYSSDLNIAENISINDTGESVNIMFDDATGHGTGIAWC